MPIFIENDPELRSKWYFGGISSAAAACITHPMDLVKVHLQTHQKMVSLREVIRRLYTQQGILGFYSGLSATLTRKFTYTTTRYGLYEAGKAHISSQTVTAKIGLAILAGIFGGIIGVPTDVVNVRMQNDIKLPMEQRRNYKHVFDGLIRICREEGFLRLFTGTTVSVSRGVLITISQNVVYDQLKISLIATNYFVDDLKLHFVASLLAGGTSTAITQPLDVLKTRSMNAKIGVFKGIWEVVTYTARLGPVGFFKGYVPSFISLGPQTVLSFLIMEQLRLHFGIRRT